MSGNKNTLRSAITGASVGANFFFTIILAGAANVGLAVGMYSGLTYLGALGAFFPGTACFE